MSLSSKLLLSGALTALALGLACSGGGSNVAPQATTGTADVLVTDAPSDNWDTVQVQVTQVILVSQGGGTQVVAFNGASTVNLVDLDSVGELLAAARVPVGTYDKVIIKVNTDPSTMSIIPEATGSALLPGEIHVLGNGVITFTLSTPLVVSSTASNAVQVDFDLSHPLFLGTFLPSGDAVLNFQVKQRPTPGLLHLIQIHRHLGTVSSIGASSFVMATQAGPSLTINTDGNTLFYDADNHPFTPGPPCRDARHGRGDGRLPPAGRWQPVCGARCGTAPRRQRRQPSQVVARRPRGERRHHGPRLDGRGQCGRHPATRQHHPHHHLHLPEQHFAGHRADRPGRRATRIQGLPRGE